MAITLTNSTAGGTWTSGNPSVATIGSANGILSGIAGGVVTITYTMSSGCFQVKSITVNPITAISGGNTVCAGSMLTLSDLNPGGTWVSSIAAKATIGSASGIVTGLASGTTLISYTLSTGCRATTMVTVNPVSAITGTASTCAGLSTTIANAISGGTWTIDNSSVATIGATTGIVSGVAPGTANATYTLPTGCFSTKVVAINAFPGAISGAGTVCAGSGITLSNSVTGGIWSSGSATIATVDGSGIVTGVLGGTSVIQYTMGTGCTVSATVTVSPIMPITGTNNACITMTTTLSDASTGGVWSSSNSSVATISTTGVVTGITAGTSTVSYALPSGCARTTVVSVNPIPHAITGTASVCTGLTTTLNGDAAGGSWTTGNVAIAIVGSNTGIVTGVAAGVVAVTYTSGLNCRVSSTVSVNGIAAITGVTKVCAGSVATLANTATGGTWTSSAADIATIDPSSGVYTSVAAGTSVITYTPATGCYRTITVTVNPIPGAIGGTSSLCVGNSGCVTNTTAGGVSWISSNSGVVTVGLTSGIVNGVSAGTALITYNVNTGCFITKIVSVNANPTAISGALSICNASSATLSSSPAGGLWTGSNAGIAGVSAASGIFTGVSAGTVLVTYTSPLGCTASSVLTINTIPNAGIITGSTYNINTITLPVSVTLASSGIASGSWTSSDNSIATVNSSGSVDAVGAGIATITYTVAQGGCSTFATRAINVAAAKAPETALLYRASEITVYPNPTNGALNMVTEENGVLDIYTPDGRMINSYLVAKGTTTITLPNELSPGTYIGKFRDSGNRIAVVSIMYLR